MDNKYWIERRGQHAVIRILIEDLHIYDVVLDVLGNLYDQVLELGNVTYLANSS